MPEYLTTVAQMREEGARRAIGREHQPSGIRPDGAADTPPPTSGCPLTVAAAAVAGGAVYLAAHLIAWAVRA